MDKRLLVEFIPGIAFLIGHALDGLFLGAGLATLATAVAIFLRWRWDKDLPWLAIAIFALTVVLVIAALIFEDATFIKISATVGSLAFAGIIAVGMIPRPSLLKRSLGYKMQITEVGWTTLHLTWIGLSVARAGLNEAVWRTLSDTIWAVYNGVSDFVWFALFYMVTSAIAHRHWNGPEDD